MPSITTAQRLQQALRDTAGKCPVAPANHQLLRHQGDTVFRSADELLGYHRYRRSAGAFKARNKGASIAFEQSALAQSKSALRSAGSLSRSAMTVLQQATHTGWLHEVHSNFTAAVATSGEVQVADLWRQVRNDPAFATHLAQLGLGADVLSACDEHLATAQGSVVERNGALVMRQGSAPEIVLGGMPQGRPRTVVDLLQRGGAAALMDHVIAGRPGPGPTLTVPADRIPVDAFVAAGIALASKQVADHTRRMEDTGVATYEGNDPATILFIIGVVLLIAGAIGSFATCDSDNTTLYNPDLCIASQIALFLGLVLMGVGGWALLTNAAATAGIAGLAFGAGFPVLLLAVLGFEAAIDVDITVDDF
jgi:hypothetical protein